MTTIFQPAAFTINLNEAPWSVTREISIYVKLVSGQLSLYNNAACQGRSLQPASFEIFSGQSTGLYFYIAAGSDAGTHFPDPNLQGGGQLPVAWENGGSCPATVFYGKIREDLSAFSMADSYAHSKKEQYSFDIVVASGVDDKLIRTSMFKEIDPTIVEKGEDPPSGY